MFLHLQNQKKKYFENKESHFFLEKSYLFSIIQHPIIRLSVQPPRSINTRSPLIAAIDSHGFRFQGKKTHRLHDNEAW